MNPTQFKATGKFSEYRSWGIVLTKFVWWTCVRTWSSAINSLVACRFIFLMASFWTHVHLSAVTVNQYTFKRTAGLTLTGLIGYVDLLMDHFPILCTPCFSLMILKDIIHATLQLLLWRKGNVTMATSNKEIEELNAYKKKPEIFLIILSWQVR